MVPEITQAPASAILSALLPLQIVIQFSQEEMMKHIRHLFKNCAGASAIEYALVAAFIAVAAILAITNLGTNVSNTYNSVSSNMNN